MFPNTGNKMPQEYTRYHICKEMGWDYFTYLSQPSFFIDEIIDCINAEETVKGIKNNTKSNG
jgi:hypothetical protein